MADYIKREDAIKRFSDIKESGVSFSDAIYLDGVMAVLDTIPAADVREVRRGRWIRDKWPSGTHKMICSECSEWSSKKSRYCPSCGARMDKEDEHETS